MPISTHLRLPSTVEPSNPLSQLPKIQEPAAPAERDFWKTAKLSMLMRTLACLALALLTLPANAQTPGSTIYYRSGPPETITTPAGGFGYEVGIERAGHALTLCTPEYPNGGASRGGGIAFITSSGSGATAVVRSLLVTPTVRPPAPRGPNDPPAPPAEWWVRDTTAGQDSPHYPGRPIGTVSLLTCAWTTTGGVANHYFAIPDTRVGHGLVYGNAGGAWSTVSAGSFIGTYSEGTSGTPVPLPWFTAFATAPADSASAFIADLTTDEKTLPGVTDVRAPGAWAFDPDYAIYPLVAIQVQMEAREAGHAFTVHGWVPGAPQQLKPVVAVAGPSGATLSFDLGAGMQFWITRDAEDGGASQPGAPATGAWTASANAVCSALNCFPATPLRVHALVAHPFRINALTRAGHAFSVQMSDGYVTDFGPAANAQTSAYAAGQIESWLDNGTPNHLPVYTFTAMVDPTRMVTLHDTTNGTQIGVPVNVSAAPAPGTPPGAPAVATSTDWLDGWQPIHALPPANPTITLRLPNPRIFDLFQLRRSPPDAWSSIINGSANGRIYLSLDIGGEVLVNGVDGMASYTLYFSTVSMAHPLPYEAGPFLLDDLDTSETRASVSAGFNDLTNWFAPPLPVNLQISSSRAGHNLAVLHPNGEFFPIVNGLVAGSTTAPPDLPPWYQSYFYFNATAVARAEMPFYVEDADTEERIGPNPNNDQLINWIAVPAPGTLTGGLAANGTIELHWPLSNLASEQGGFEIERQLTGQTWQTLGTLAADIADENGLLHFTDAAPVLGKTHSYRIRYTFGSGPALRRSAPTIALTLTGWLDGDGDGLPGWWELKYQLNPNDPSDANQTSAGGMTYRDKYDQGLDPSVADSDGDGVPDASDAVAYDPDFTFPRVPVTHYAVLDVGSGKALAINDAGQVLFQELGTGWPYGDTRLWAAGSSTLVVEEFEGYALGLTEAGTVVGNLEDYWGHIGGFTKPFDTALSPIPLVIPAAPSETQHNNNVWCVSPGGDYFVSEGWSIAGGSHHFRVLRFSASGHTVINTYDSNPSVWEESFDFFGVVAANARNEQLKLRTREHEITVLEDIYETGNPVAVSRLILDSVDWQLDSEVIGNNSRSITVLNAMIPPLLAGSVFLAGERAAAWVKAGGIWKEKTLRGSGNDPAPVAGHAVSINDRGQILLDGGRFWQNGRVEQLNGLVDQPQWFAIEATDINNHGLISARAMRQSFDANGLPVGVPTERAVVLLPFEVIPFEAAAANTDQTKIYFTAILPSTDQDNLENSLGEGGIIEWEVESGGGTLDETETTTEGGSSTVALDITGAAVGAMHKVKARIMKLTADGTVIAASWMSSAAVETFPGDPAQITATKDREDFRNDGTDVMEIEATILDADGNPVLDGTGVEWEISATDAEFVSKEEETANGKAKATLRSPHTARAFELAVRSGEGSHTETIQVHKVSGTLSSNKQSLNLSNSESATLTASVDAADGTPVYWFASNGQITRQSTVSNGSATATVSSAGGQLGAAVVSATVGGKMFTWQGSFTSTTGLFIGVENKVLVRNVLANGVETITPPTGVGSSRDIPYYHRTKIFGRGAPNSEVTITVPTLNPPMGLMGVGAMSAISGGGEDEGTPYVQQGSITVTTDSTGYFEVIYDPPLSVEGGVDKLLIQSQQVGGGSHSVEVPYADISHYLNSVTEVESQVNPDGGGSALQTAAELVRDIFFGDIMDGATILDNMAKFAGLKEGEPNWSETAWAAGSIAVNFVPGGAIAKRLLGPLGRIAAKLGKESKFGEVLWERGIKALKKEKNLTEFVERGELAFVERLDADETLLRKLNSANASDAYIDQCVRLDKKIGTPLWTKIKQVEATPEEVQKIISAIGESSDEALELLQTGGKATGNNLDTAIDGVRAAVKDGHNSGILQGVLNKAELDTPNYNRVDLLSDLGRKDLDGFALAEKPGMKKMLGKMGSKSPRGRGIKYQLQAASDLERKGFVVKVVETPIGFDKDFYRNANGTFSEGWKTDIDIVATKAGKKYNCNVKSSAIALNGGSYKWPPEKAAQQLSNWIGAQIKKDGKDTVRIVVPPGVDRAPHIDAVIRKYGLRWADIVVESSTP